MTPLPFALVLFLAAVTAVAVMAPVLAIRAFAEARVEAALGVRSVSPRARFERALRRVVFALAALGAVCVAYGRLVEPFWPEVERIRITSAKWPSGAPPLRIVHISDLHCDPEPRLEPRLPGLVAAERPDAIVFTGDAINEPASIPVLRTLMTRLAHVAPVFAVRGNWDVGYWSRLDLFGGTGVQELDGHAVPVSVRGTNVYFSGVPVGSVRKAAAALGEAPPDALRVFLYHYPDEIYDVAQLGADLYLAGHTHGGQVALPLYGALITLARHGKRFEAGLYKVGATHLYVNRGIGMEGGAAPRVRFWARPEITLIEVAGISDKLISIGSRRTPVEAGASPPESVPHAASQIMHPSSPVLRILVVIDPPRYHARPRACSGQRDGARAP